MKNEMMRGSVFSCLREYVQELHPLFQSKIAIEGVDALLGVKGFITFAILFKEVMNLERYDVPTGQKILIIRVTSQIENGMLILKVFLVPNDVEHLTIDARDQSLQIINNAAASLGGSAACKASKDGLEWLLNFSLQKISS